MHELSVVTLNSGRFHEKCTRTGGTLLLLHNLLIHLTLCVQYRLHLLLVYHVEADIATSSIFYIFNIIV